MNPFERIKTPMQSSFAKTRTPEFHVNLEKSPGRSYLVPRAERHLLIVSDLDHTLTTNDCGEQVARRAGIGADEFFRTADAIGAKAPQFKNGGEFAAMAAVAEHKHPKFERLTRAQLIDASADVKFKANLGQLYRKLEQGMNGWTFTFVISSAGPQDTVRAAAANEGIPSDHVIGSRFSFFANGDLQGLVHANADEGKADSTRDLQHLINIPRHHVMGFGDGSSDVGNFRHIQRVGGRGIAVKDNAKLVPYQYGAWLDDKNDVMNWLPAIKAFTTALESSEQSVSRTGPAPHTLLPAWHNASTDPIESRKGLFSLA